MSLLNRISLVLMLGGGFATAFDGPTPRVSRKALLFADGYVDPRGPDPEKFGTTNGGLFGLLPEYLRALGYPSTWGHSLESGDIEDVSLIVVINQTRALSSSEAEAVRAWVKRGGALWVLGDHTDVFGSHAPLNALTDPYGIHFEFDTVEMFRPHFTGGMKTVDERFSRRSKHDVELQMGRGASLRVEGGAWPVVIGTQTFADNGNRENAQGAFMGDGRHQRDEGIWDRVLIAAAEDGAGRVLVCGDTSVLQNLALPMAAGSFVPDCLDWLTGRTSGAGWVGLGLGLAGAVMCLLSRGAWVAGMLSFILGVLTGSIATVACISPVVFCHERLAVVDASHHQGIDLWPGTERAIDGILANLQRAGRVPVVMHRWESAWVRSAGCFVTVAPREEYGRSERQDLDEMVDGGGRVFVFASYDTSAPINTWLSSSVGIEIKAVPLGSVPIVRDGETRNQEIQFFNAAPIGYGVAPDRATRAGMDVLYQHNGLASAVKCRKGAGDVVVIADDTWPLGKRLESVTDFHGGNIRWFQQLIKEGRP